MPRVFSELLFDGGEHECSTVAFRCSLLQCGRCGRGRNGESDSNRNIFEIERVAPVASPQRKPSAFYQIASGIRAPAAGSTSSERSVFVYTW